MKKIFKFPSLILILALLISTFASCGKYAVSVSGSEVDEQEFRYFLFNHYRDLLDDGDTREADEILNQAKEEAVNDLLDIYAVQKLAKDNKIEINDAETQEIEAKMDSMKEDFKSDEEFESYLAESWLFPSLAKKILEYQILDEKVREYLTDEYTGNIPSDDKTVSEDIEKNFYRATQILIEFDNHDSKEEAEKIAKEAYAALQSGEEFTSAAAKYSEDTVDIKTGYYFTKGQMLEEFEEAALTLNEGETSEIVESPYGYHIIKRLPLEQSYIDANFETLRELYKNRCFNEQLQEVKDKAKVDINESIIKKLYNEAKTAITVN